MCLLGDLTDIDQGHFFTSCDKSSHLFLFPCENFLLLEFDIKKNFDFCGYASTLFCSSQCEYIAFLNVFQLSDIRNTPTVLYFDFKAFLIFVFVILFSHICLFCICALVHDRDYLCLFGLLPFLPRPTGHPVEIYNEISGHNFIT